MQNVKKTQRFGQVLKALLEFSSCSKLVSKCMKTEKKIRSWVYEVNHISFTYLSFVHNKATGKKRVKDWGCSSVAGHVVSVHQRPWFNS